MGDDRIEELLRQADRAAGARPAMPPDLAGRVRRLARRRRAVRITTGAVAAALAVGIATAVFMAGPHGEPAPVDNTLIVDVDNPQDDLVRLRVEFGELRAEAEATLAVARRILDLQSEQKLLAELARIRARPDPVEEVRQQMDKAAFIIVYQADRMYRELNLHESAIASYRQSIKLFPQTRWADVARERLAEIESPKGDQL